MAKRKAARSARGKARKGAKTSKKRTVARKPTARRAAAKKSSARKSRAGARKTVARKPVRKVASTRKTQARKASARKAPARKAQGRKAPAPKAVAPKAPSRKIARSPSAVIARKAPALDRARRIVQGDDIVLATPPSSLDLDRTASAARTGRRQMRERLSEHNETSPALTAGDVDADWESAASVGDEAPGGDNPTPDQDVVDDIGKAVGVQYEDNEELKGEAKITKRDKHRWELDPASSEDYEDR
jgi:hypothetical protein